MTSNISNLTLSSVIETEDTAAAVFSGGAKFCFFATNGGAVDFPVQMTIPSGRGNDYRFAGNDNY